MQLVAVTNFALIFPFSLFRPIDGIYLQTMRVHAAGLLFLASLAYALSRVALYHLPVSLASELFVFARPAVAPGSCPAHELRLVER